MMGRAHSLAAALVILFLGRAWAQQDSIVLAASLPLTGPQASYGQDLRDGAKACLAAAPGGKSVQLEVLDDAGDPARTLQNIRTLSANPRTLLILGSFGAEATQAALPALQEARVAMVGPATGSEALRAQINRYVFHLRASNVDEAAAITNQLAELGIQEAVVVHSNDALGRDALEGARTEMIRLAFRPIAIIALDNTGSASPAAMKTLIAAKPPAVILIAHQTEAAQFMAQLRATDLRPTVTGVSEVAGELLFERLGTGARGIGLTQVLPHPWSANLPVTRFYQAAMKDAGLSKLSYYSLEGCVQVRVALEALKRAVRPLNRERAIAALESEFDLGGLRFQFAPGKRQGGRFVEMTVVNQAGRISR